MHVIYNNTALFSETEYTFLQFKSRKNIILQDKEIKAI
jgi:hypothetical protein